MISIIQLIEKKYINHLSMVSGFGSFTVGYIFIDKTYVDILAHELLSYENFKNSCFKLDELKSILLLNTCKYRGYQIKFVDNLLAIVEVFSR